ncbi:NlpC/P60 family protein [Levilactobacillus hammesii]|uniref:Cell wall-associated hydrolase n=1 Tax=Levilactobacillus hammesii DSM 16381 TaxID=1423753 RepID=A0A0R1UQ67_9LACO|nr:NlpC/P60 family protein [Levilactobacillus hammesii]KRL93544.1 cell wall-associated hydrolase [Levilactobacillus hammesii DSM 16381]
MKKVVKLLAAFALVMVGVFAISMSTTTTASADSNSSFKSVYKVAKSHLGARYVYGATGPSAFDCSGFTGYIYKKGAKTTLPRTAQAQYNKYKHVSYKNIQKGDLVFFGYSAGSISHVGMYIGNGKMIDAQNRGVVREAVHAPWWHAVGYARVTTATDAD